MNNLEIQDWLVEHISRRIGRPKNEVDLESPLEQYGLDSQEAISLTGELEVFLGCRVDPTALWDHRTVAELTAHLAGLVHAELVLPESEAGLDALLRGLSR